MSIATVASDIASQQEFLRPKLELLYMSSSRLWKFIKARTDVKAVSNRPARIPYEVLAGGKFRVANFDGPSQGRGSGTQQTFGQLSCVSFTYAWEYTALAEWSTDSNTKAVEDYVSTQNKRAAAGFAAYMDSLVCYGDGANTLDTVVSTPTNGIVVNNANAFQDNQDIDIWSALTPGGFVGTVTILSVDIGNNTIWLTGPVPGGVGAGYFLLMSGSAGVVGSGLAGLKAYNVGGNAGQYMGIQRSAFPGKFSTPTNSTGGALTPAAVRAIAGQVKLAMSIERAEEADLRPHCNLDQQAAWENIALLVQHVIANEVKGDQATDMLRKDSPTMMGGREMIPNERAIPGRIDWLSIANWWRIETSPFGYYSVAGQTVFPAYGADGGVATSMLFYLKQITQVGASQPRLNAVQSNLTIPKGWFGH